MKEGYEEMKGLLVPGVALVAIGTKAQVDAVLIVVVLVVGAEGAKAGETAGEAGVVVRRRTAARVKTVAIVTKWLALLK